MTEIRETFLGFLTYCQFQKNLSPKTLKAYSIDTRQFLDFLSCYSEINEVTDITRDILRDFLKHLSEKHKIKTVKRKIACLKAFFNYLEYEDRIIVNPFRKLKIRLKEPFNLPMVMTLSEIENLFRSVYGCLGEFSNKECFGYKSCVRDVAVLELLFATGLRVSELCSLKKGDLDIESGYVKVRGKGNKERVIFIGNEEVKNALLMYKSIFEEKLEHSEVFFVNRLNSRLSEQSVRLMVKKYVRQAGIEKHVTPHAFRHSFATLLLEEGVDIKYIQSFLGHSSIMTTQIYTHVNREKQREILGTMHPRGGFRVNEG